MLKYSKLTFVSLLIALTSSFAYAESKNFATVNGVNIPQARFDMRIKAAMSQGQADSPDLRNAIREDLINLEILAQAATKKGLNKQAVVVEQHALVTLQYELTKQSILASAFIQAYVKDHPISDDELKQEYDRIVKLRGNKEYKVSHILVKTETEAKAVGEQLLSGKFEDVAMNKSQDPGSSVKGGDLGWNLPSNFVKPFADAMVGMNKSQVSAPVQSQFGWHIIKLEDTRDLKVPSFDEVKPNLAQQLQQQKAISEQRAKAKVK